MDKKIHINVGTIGHVDHSKTTLTQAITTVLAMSHRIKAIDTKRMVGLFDFQQIDNDPAETSPYARLQKENRRHEPRRATGAAQVKRQARKQRRRR